MAARDITPPPLKGPSAKEKKYDRQLRLWAASGQAALEASHILLINSGSGVVGVETLKNLVLPGIGEFTVLDPNLVKDEDLGVNFFLDEQSLGKPRAEQLCAFLQELNPDVEGHARYEPLEPFVSDPSNLTPYSHILISAPIPHEVFTAITSQAATTDTPVFYVHCVGFYSQFSLHLPPAFPIVDTHPDPATTQDLRLIKPWTALSDFAAQKTKDLASMSEDDHGHVSYVLLLLHHLEEWKAANGGRVPDNYKEKSAFRETVSKAMRTNNAEGGEENYEEAVAAVLKSLNPPSASSAVREVFNAPECTQLNASSENFWIIANAISQFYNAHGVLPLSGSVPDMKARSADYIQLQNIYKSKARQDAEEVWHTVQSLESQFNRTPHQPVNAVEVETFCKNSGYIKLVRGRPFHIVKPGEPILWADRAKWAAGALTDDSSLILQHIAFLAWDEFCATHNADTQLTTPLPPGVAHYEADAEKLTGIAHKYIDSLLNEAATFLEDPEYSDVKTKVSEICQELARAGGAELHNIASLTGGLVAQEVIKVVTKQYVPVDNTCLFDGVRSVTAVIRV